MRIALSLVDFLCFLEDMEDIEDIVLTLPTVEEILMELGNSSFFSRIVVESGIRRVMNSKCVGARWPSLMATRYIALFGAPCEHEVQDGFWKYFSHTYACKAKRVLKMVDRDSFLVQTHESKEEILHFHQILPIFIVQYFQKYCRRLARGCEVLFKRLAGVLKTIFK